MNIEFDSYKQKLNDCRPALEGLAASLNLEGLKNELERLHAMQEAPGFWDDPEKSQKIVVKAKQAENKVERYEGMCSSWDDLMGCEALIDCQRFQTQLQLTLGCQIVKTVTQAASGEDTLCVLQIQRTHADAHEIGGGTAGFPCGNEFFFHCFTSPE